MSLKDEIYFQPANLGGKKNSRAILAFYITGNPGLIEYYRPFLSRLNRRLTEENGRDGENSKEVHVYGSSLEGFQVQSAPKSVSQGPLSLADEIACVKARFEALCRDIASQYDEPLEVIVLGHSVGAYIMLELYNATLASKPSEGQSRYEIKGLIGLFPTVVHIVKSPNGRKFGKLLQLAHIPLIISSMAYLLFAWQPLGLVTALLRLLLGMPEHGARTTAAFLKSDHGVRQALFMASDEMHSITADTWDDSFWLHDRAEQKPKMYFYFGTNDHWVDDASRNSLMKSRGRRGTVTEAGVHSNENLAKPLMEIDGNGVPHAFCFDHSEAIADKAVSYICNALRES
ncbi:Hypothetical protein R9X50_00351000 [Acrodontium crateriforme]|uniref:Lipid droplet-associated hydrolase n=1 Tax=Acrodontium crateriforme TaxID=150365 RepID=A0AAQ3M4F7_9PEZI|nr:Hypothetical protein R9X50_00351000 [Acrodontium crateriforme]